MYPSIIKVQTKLDIVACVTVDLIFTVIHAPALSEAINFVLEFGLRTHHLSAVASPFVNCLLATVTTYYGSRRPYPIRNWTLALNCLPLPSRSVRMASL